MDLGELSQSKIDHYCADFTSVPSRFYTRAGCNSASTVLFLKFHLIQVQHKSFQIKCLFFNFLIKVFQKNLKSKLNSHNFNNSVPSLVRRAMHKISLSNAIMLYFQIKLFIASMHLLTWPVGCDLANSITNTSQNERKCAVWNQTKFSQLNTYCLKSRSRHGIQLKIIHILIWPLIIHL